MKKKYTDEINCSNCKNPVADITDDFHNNIKTKRSFNIICRNCMKKYEQ